ncbi:MAG: hypothetical protein AAF697_01090 [Pseudomonadota bacterium]
MAPETGETLSNEAQLALAYTAPNLRNPLRIFFDLDARLGRIVAGTNEAMLGQMRLTWWRDMLRSDPAQRPRGDLVLDGIGQHWRGAEGSLIKLVDGWEYMLADRFDAAAARHFAENRAQPAIGLAHMIGVEETHAEKLAEKLTIWALADAAVNISDDIEREALLGLAREMNGRAPRFPRPLRGLDVLVALARRSVDRGGRPLLEGRGAALTAMRAAILGR